MTEPQAKEAPEDGQDDDWLKELSALAGEEKKVPIDEAWPEPDWLEETKSPETKQTDELLRWLRDVETGELPQAADRTEEGKADEVGFVDEYEEAGPEWMDEVSDTSLVVEDEATSDVQVEDVEQAEIEEEPSWLSELKTTDEWPEPVEEAQIDEWLEEADEEEGQKIDTAPLREPDELSNVPDQIAKKSLPSWLSDAVDVPEDAEADEVAVEFAEAGEADAIDEIEDVVESVADVPAALSEEPLEAEDQEAVESEPAPEAEPESGDAFQETDWLDQITQESISAEFAEDVEEALDWFQDPKEREEPTTSAPLEEDALLADLQRVEDSEVPPSIEEVEVLVDSDEVEVDPSWLESLTRQEREPADWEQRTEDKGPLSGLTGVLDRRSVISEQALGDEIPRQVISQELVRRTKLLEAMTAEQPVPSRLEGALSEGYGGTWPRWVLALILLLLVATGWLAPFTDFEQRSGAASDLAQTALSEAAGETVLVAFDYAPAWSGELDLLANSLLSYLAESDSTVITVSQTPAGNGMAAIVTDRIDGLDELSLGYLPGEAVGLRSLATCLEQGQNCQNIYGFEVQDEVRFELDNLGLIVILAAEQDELIRWIEQIGSVLDVDVVAGVTQALSPMTGPYVASGQIRGVLASPADVASFAASTGIDQSYSSERASSLALANWLAIIVLTVSILYGGFTVLIRGNLRTRGAS